ncbi:hypothetical protein EON81_15150 [bacterium]|nr:MAG: hypothetical protein EON81_15150 [bacterium]
MLCATLAMMLPVPPPLLKFSGYEWEISHSQGKERGPGPNVFDGGPKSVWLDPKGHLHMKIHKESGRWTTTEVVLSESKGYGTYRFTLASRVDALDPQVVVGLFTWDDEEEDAHRELDVEFSRWGDPKRSNGQFVVQPYDTLGNLTRFELPPLTRSVHSFDWLPESAAFVSKTSDGKIVAEHIFGHSIPRTGKERAIINFWLYQGKDPQNGKPSELVVEKFEFIPAPAGKRKHTESLSPTG